VLRTEQGAYREIVAPRENLGGMAKLAIDRRLVDEETDTKASEAWMPIAGQDFKTG
jgi:hypothetical protein